MHSTIRCVILGTEHQNSTSEQHIKRKKHIMSYRLTGTITAETGIVIPDILRSLHGIKDGVEAHTRNDGMSDVMFDITMEKDPIKMIKQVAELFIHDGKYITMELNFIKDNDVSKIYQYRVIGKNLVEFATVITPNMDEFMVIP